MVCKAVIAKLLKLVQSAQTAYYQKKQNRDYIVRSDIVIVDYANTGRTNEGCQWQSGIHQFLQVKHGLPPSAELLTSASISHPSFFAQYQEIYGLTGTMGEQIERLEVQEVYGVETFDVPPRFPSQRKTLKPRILPDKSKQAEVILRDIKQMKKSGRPTLILFESIKESNQFSDLLKSKGIAHQLLNETQKESEDYIIARAGESEAVTDATNTAGRGNNIILSQQSKNAGGLHMIFTFYPENSRVEEQGYGRAGRQGNPGSCCMIIHETDSRVISLLARSPEAIFLWMNATSEQEKFQILNKLRNDKIQEDSAERCYRSKLESYYFGSLSQFFSQLQSLRILMRNEEFEEQLKITCKSELRTDTTFFINLNTPRWRSIYLAAKTLLANQKLERVVDWASWVTQFKEAYIENLLEILAAFYSKLTEETYGMEIDAIPEKIKIAYDELNIASYCIKETIIACLTYILSFETLCKDEKLISERTAIGPFFSSNPKQLYDEAIKSYKGKNYEDTLIKCDQAIKIYLDKEQEFIKKIKESQSIYKAKEPDFYCAIIHCYSTKASCYRELKQFEQAFASCEQAIKNFISLKPSSKNEELIAHTIAKYQDCLEKCDLSLKQIYDGAISLYKEKNFLSVKIRLLYLLEKESSISPCEKGSCYSTLASCYREVGEMENAITACEKAITAFKLAKEIKSIKSATLKLESLLTSIHAERMMKSA